MKLVYKDPTLEKEVSVWISFSHLCNYKKTNPLAMLIHQCIISKLRSYLSAQLSTIDEVSNHRPDYLFESDYYFYNEEDKYIPFGIKFTGYLTSDNQYRIRLTLGTTQGIDDYEGEMIYSDTVLEDIRLLPLVKESIKLDFSRQLYGEAIEDMCEVVDQLADILKAYPIEGYLKPKEVTEVELSYNDLGILPLINVRTCLTNHPVYYR